MNSSELASRILDLVSGRVDINAAIRKRTGREVPPNWVREGYDTYMEGVDEEATQLIDEFLAARQEDSPVTGAAITRIEASTDELKTHEET